MIRCDSIDANFLLYSPHMCLRSDIFVQLYFVSHALLLYAVRTGCRSQHMVCRNLKERVHGRTGAPDTDMGTFPLKKTASPANLILHV